MRFWDASGLVAVCARDRHYEAAIPILREDPEVVVWWGTRVECVSGVKRRRREGVLDPEGERAALRRLDELARGWTEIAPTGVLRDVAERLLHRHVLRAADALQLSAAMDWTGEAVTGAVFVTFDEKLAGAATIEGFTVRPA